MKMNIEKISQIAKQGNHEWSKLYEEYSVEPNDYIFCIPFYSNTFSLYVLKYIKQFINKNTNNKIYIIIDNDVINKAIIHCELDVQVIQLCTDRLEVLITYYNLYMFTDKLVILSPNLPLNRTAYNLVKQGLIDVEEYISVGLLKNTTFLPGPRISYVGNDPDLENFFNVKEEAENIEL